MDFFTFYLQSFVLSQVCQANLILKKKLEPGRIYDFRVEVRNQRGQLAAMNCSFQATNATTPIERIFPGAPTLLAISENARRNTELGKKHFNICEKNVITVLN